MLDCHHCQTCSCVCVAQTTCNTCGFLLTSLLPHARNQNIPESKTLSLTFGYFLHTGHESIKFRYLLIELSPFVYTTISEYSLH